MKICQRLRSSTTRYDQAGVANVRDNKDIVPQKQGRGRGTRVVFLIHLLKPGGEVGVHGGKGTPDRVRDGLEILGVKHRAPVQRGCAFLEQLVPQELDGGETGVAVEDGGEGEAVEEGVGAEDDLVLHLLASSLQLGAAPPDGLQLRRRRGARRHASRRRHLASRSGGSNPAAAQEGSDAGAGGVGGERQPRNTRAQQRHTSGVIFLFSFSRYTYSIEKLFLAFDFLLSLSLMEFGFGLWRDKRRAAPWIQIGRAHV